MRVLHVVPTYFPAVRYGGPISSVHGLCKALARRGHDVDVYTTNVDGSRESDVPVETRTELDGVGVRYFAVPAFRRLYWSPRLLAALRRDVAKFDVVHTHSVFLWPTSVAARSAAANRLPYVLSPRGMLVKELIERKNRWIKGAWIRAVEASNIERAAAIHVTSKVEADELGRFGFDLPAVKIVANGVEQVPAPPRAAASAGIKELVEGAPYVLFIGRLNWKKGLDRMIEALAIAREVRLVVAGNDEEGYGSALAALSKRSGVERRIAFVGPVYGEDKQVLLSNARAMVVPSYSENFGNVVLEAMAAGCPVLATRQVGAAAILEEHRAGIVVDGDIASLARGVSAIYADPEGSAAMGKRGSDAAAEHYSWDAIAEKMEEVYQSIRILPLDPHRAQASA